MGDGIYIFHYEAQDLFSHLWFLLNQFGRDPAPSIGRLE